MWTGYVGNDGTGGGPVIDNAEAGYDWSTYPERLEAAGVSWKIYQDRAPASTPTASGAGPTTPTSATTATTRCCTSTSTRTPQPGAPLYEKARTGTNVDAAARATFFDILKADVQQRQAAAGLLDRRARGVLRAPELAGQLRRLVRRRRSSTP